MKNSSSTTTDCPLCRGEKVHPDVQEHKLFQKDAIGLRSTVTWKLDGTTLVQTVESSYTSDFDDHYDEDFTPETHITIPIYGLSHCPCCRRRLVGSIEENDHAETTKLATPARPVPREEPNLHKAWSEVLNSNFKKENPEC